MKRCCKLCICLLRRFAADSGVPVCRGDPGGTHADGGAQGSPCTDQLWYGAGRI